MSSIVSALHPNPQLSWEAYDSLANVTLKNYHLNAPITLVLSLFDRNSIVGRFIHDRRNGVGLYKILWTSPSGNVMLDF